MIRSSAVAGGMATVVVLWTMLLLVSTKRGNHNPDRYRVLGLSFGGYCARCDTHHVLPTTDRARKEAIDLRDRMLRSGRIDIDELPMIQRKRLLERHQGSCGEGALAGSGDCHGYVSGADDDDLDPLLDPLLATERLYERRGKMFGVLVCQRELYENSTSIGSNNPDNGDDTTVVLKAYAGKLGGQWNLPGWAPLVGRVPESLPEFRRLSAEVTELFSQIHTLSEEQRQATEGGDQGTDNDHRQHRIRELTKQRSRLSSASLAELRKHQVLPNPRGIRMPIAEAFAKGPGKLPGGTGDCAAPKLVAWALQRNLRPVGICEIFVGATGGMSTTKNDGKFYDACEPRCQQIAGHMLCGLDDVHNS